MAFLIFSPPHASQCLSLITWLHVYYLGRPTRRPRTPVRRTLSSTATPRRNPGRSRPPTRPRPQPRPRHRRPLSPSRCLLLCWYACLAPAHGSVQIAYASVATAPQQRTRSQHIASNRRTASWTELHCTAENDFPPAETAFRSSRPATAACGALRQPSAAAAVPRLRRPVLHRTVRSQPVAAAYEGPKP